MKEKLGELVHWLKKLKASLIGSDADDDREELESRARLAKSASRTRLSCHPKLIACRSFDDIEKRSRLLLEEGEVAWILDKPRDSQPVVRLIEKLRLAILINQVGARVTRFGLG